MAISSWKVVKNTQQEFSQGFYRENTEGNKINYLIGYSVGS